MKRHYAIEFIVGIFLILAFAALMVLAFKVSGLTTMGANECYRVYADFDNVGGLKVRAPVSIAGVRIGEVSKITLNPQTLRAHVTLFIEKRMEAIPDDSSASILTQGLLGANYISISPGFEETALKPGATLSSTHSAMILENILGQIIYQVTGDKSENKKMSEKTS